MLLFRAGTIYRLHVEDISQVLPAQVDKVECNGRKRAGRNVIDQQGARKLNSEQAVA